jgi:4'-phosphopantetheinyl transferase
MSLTETIHWCLLPFPQPAIARDSLSLAEKTAYEHFRFDARRESWLAGRYTAKTLLSKVLNGRKPLYENFELEQIEIRNDPLGAPKAYHADKPITGCLSISHSGDYSAVAYAPSNLQVGIDIEEITPRSAGFIQDYFTEHEVEMITSVNGEKPVEHNQTETATLIWSAKEALLKAMGIGLRLDTRHVEVISIEDGDHTDALGWKQLGLSSSHLTLRVDAYWRRFDGYLLTLAVLMDGDDKIALVEAD